MKHNNINILIIFFIIFFGCAPQQKMMSIDDVEKQRADYLDGNLKSLSVKPTARNIDLLGDLSFPSTTFEEYFLIVYCTNLPNILNLHPFKNFTSELFLAKKSMSLLLAISV